MTVERELLTQAAERLSRHSVSIPDLMLGDRIFKHLRSTKERIEPEQKLEQED